MQKLNIVACGVIIGLSKSPDMHPAQYLFSKQWSEREQLILDELWIVLEEKLKLRKQLLDARQTVSDKLNAIDECERRQEDSDKILRFVLNVLITDPLTASRPMGRRWVKIVDLSPSITSVI